MFILLRRTHCYLALCDGICMKGMRAITHVKLRMVAGAGGVVLGKWYMMMMVKVITCGGGSSLSSPGCN